MKTEQDKTKPRNANTLATDVNGFDIKAQHRIDELHKKKAMFEQKAAEAYKTNPALAQKYFQAARSINSHIAAIDAQRINSEMAVIGSQMNELTVDAAKILQSTAATQNEAVRAVNPEKIHTLADIVAQTSAQLSHTSKITNSALGGITERANADREEAEEDIELGEEGKSSDFLLWIQQQQAGPTPTRTPAASSSSSSSSSSSDWRTKLREAVPDNQ